MYTQILAQHAQAYLDATAELRRCRGAGTVPGACGRAAAEAARAEEELVERLDRPHDYADRPLVNAARAYVDAEHEYEQAVVTGVGVVGATRVVDATRDALAARLRHVDENPPDAPIPVTDTIAVTDTEAPAPLTVTVASDGDAPPARVFVVAADDSEPAHWAVRVAARMAREAGARLLLVGVVVPTPVVAGEYGMVSDDMLPDDKARAAGILARLAESVPPDVPCDRAVRVGLIADEIVIAARLAGAELILLGTRGRGRFARFLLGSTAEAVIRHAPCPVVTVGRPPAMSPATSAPATVPARAAPPVPPAPRPTRAVAAVTRSADAPDEADRILGTTLHL